MKLYRIVHKSLIEEVWNRPQIGAIVDNTNVYFSAYDSFSMAVLEHPFYKLVLGLPITFYLITYRILDIHFEHLTEYPDTLYKENSNLERNISRSLKAFLNENISLLAKFRSKDWPTQANFLINVMHPSFKEIEIEEISVVR